MSSSQTPTIAYAIDPRFPGGTSSAVAAELAVISEKCALKIYALQTAMFKGQTVAPQLQAALNRLNLPIVWDAPEIAADIVILHNPSCLKFQDTLPIRIITPHLVAVTHENFLRPGGAESFDVAAALKMLEKASFAAKRSLAPISPWNRKTIADWQQKHGALGRWQVLDQDWFNICDFPLVDPVSQPRDRRGRHSRTGFEKFPLPEVLLKCFPSHAESNVMLGADVLLLDPEIPAHWDLHPFRSMNVDDYFKLIDFMIYFTSPTLRESFGRVLAEGVAAGKIVISDKETAATFDGAVRAATPEQVDGIVQEYLSEPAKYAKDVRAAQAKLAQFSPEAFSTRFDQVFATEMGLAG